VELGDVSLVQVKVRQQGVPVAPQQRPQPAPQRASAQTEFARIQVPASMPQLVSDKPQTLDEGQTFDSFMVGAANQLAHAAASRVALAAPGAALGFNPLYIHAASGLGKSHLLNAIAHRVKASGSGRRVLMLTAERFMYGFIQAVRQRDTLSFKDQFNAVDVLLIDDFQFLQGKAIQQEFCHAFNSLVDQRRQVVIAADVPPSQLDAVDQRMRSRMMGGLVVDIELPDEALRCKIVRARHEQMLQRDPTQSVPVEVLDLIAERTTGGGRELEGALNRVIAYQQFNNTPITLDLASVVLRDASQNGNMDPGRIKIDDILKVVGRHYNVAKADLLSPRRSRTVVVPRQIGMYLAKKLTSRSLPEIGRRFGGRDHSTVLHAVRKIDEQVRVDEKLAKDVALLIRLMEQV
jgi:chromosomal replication initiator protein